MSQEKSGLFADFCDVCTCMGVVDWYREKYWPGKLFWFVVILVGLGLTGVQTYLTIEAFINRKDYETKISTEPTKDGIPSPNIIVCNYNRAKQNLINKTKLDPKVLVYMFDMMAATYPIPLSKAPNSVLSEHEEAWKSYMENGGDPDIENVLRFYGHQENDTFINVARKSPIERIQYLGVLTVYGLCWNVKFSENFGFTTGSQSGVHMILDPLLEEYMKDVVYNNYLQQGFVIAINYENEPLIPIPLFINPGTYTTIALDATIRRASAPSLPMLKLKCNENAKLKIINESYTPQNCAFDCFVEAALNVCGCTLWPKTMAKHPLCNMTQSLRCAKPDIGTKNVTDVLPYMKVVKQFATCKERCIYPCEDFRHLEATTTATSFSPNLKSALSLLLQTTFNVSRKQLESLSNNVVVLQIYLKADYYTIYETIETTPIMDFIGNLGGQLGLWLGISFCTIVQLCYYTLVGFCGKLRSENITGIKN